jgi:ribonuclease P protein component
MRIEHLLKRASFLAAAEHGRRFRSHAFTVQLLVRQAAEADHMRLGLTASRKAGNAVERNRIRRRLRAAAEQAFTPSELAETDVVIIARHEVLYEPFEKLVSELAQAPRRAKSRTARTPSKLHAPVASPIEQAAAKRHSRPPSGP